MHRYEVTLSDGSKHLATTPHHHNDHPHHTFQAHLLDVIKNALGSALGGLLVSAIVHKGRVR